MKWTDEKPTEPGWYWHRESVLTRGMPTKVSSNGDVFRARNILRDCMLDKMGGQWAGPIPEPTE